MIFQRHNLNHRDHYITKWSEGLIRLIQTTIEVVRVTNATGSPMQNGHVVKLIAGKRQCRLATGADATFTGVLCEACPPGGTAICRTSNLACIMFASGQVPVEGELAYLGPEGGVAYTSGRKPIGEIADASRFTAEHPFAKVLLIK